MNKGRFILGIGLMVLAATIFTITQVSTSNVLRRGSSKEGKTVVNTQRIPGIHSILADGIVDVHITKGDTELVRYEFNDGDFENESTFENGELEIDFSSAHHGFSFFGTSTSNVDVYVTVKELKRISMDGIGSIKTTNKLLVDKLNIRNEGTGSIKIEVDGNEIDARNDGVGSLTLLGSATKASLSNSGVGSVHAEAFIVQVLDADNDGVGSMKVFAEKEISMRNSGVGSIKHGGNAQVIKSNSDGVGSITKY